MTISQIVANVEDYVEALEQMTDEELKVFFAGALTVTKPTERKVDNTKTTVKRKRVEKTQSKLESILNLAKQKGLIE